MLDKDHLAADVACIWTKIRVIECNTRSRFNHEINLTLDELQEVALDIEHLITKWENKQDPRHDLMREVRQPQPDE